MIRLCLLLLTAFWAASLSAEEIITESLRTLEHDGAVISMSIASDGSDVVTVSVGEEGISGSPTILECTGAVRLWSSFGGNVLRTYELEDDDPDTYVCMLAAALNTQQKQVLTGSSEGIGYLFDLNTGKIEGTFSGHADVILDAAFSPKSNQVATGSADNTARLWNSKTGAVEQVFNHGDRVWSISFSPKGDRLLTAGNDTLAKLWDTTSGSLIRTFDGHNDWIVSSDYAPDNKRIVTASLDQNAKIWDIETGAVIVSLYHEVPIWSVAFTPDGDAVATGSANGEVNLWDAATGELLRSYVGHTRQVNAVGFSPDGVRLFSASDDKTLKTWVTNLPEREEFELVDTPEYIETVSDRFRIIDAYAVPGDLTWVDGILVRMDRMDLDISDALPIGPSQILRRASRLTASKNLTGYAIVMSSTNEGNRAVVQTNDKKYMLEMLGFADGVLYLYLPRDKIIVRVTGSWGEGVGTGSGSSSADLNVDGKIDSLDLLQFSTRWHQSSY